MPLFIIVLLFSSILGVSFLNFREANPIDSNNISSYISNNIAEDLLFDLNIAKNYLKNNNSFQGLIPQEKLSPYYKYIYKNKEKYDLSDFNTYSFIVNSRHYVLITWENIKNTIKAVPNETIENNVIGELSKLVGENNQLNSILIGKNPNLNCEIEPNSLMEKNIEDEYLKVLNDLCRTESTSKKWKYIILQQL